MRIELHRGTSSKSDLKANPVHVFRGGLRVAVFAATVAALGGGMAALAQNAEAVTAPISTPEYRALPGHVPMWANAANLAAAVPVDEPMAQMMMVLARPADREQAFEKLLADQQDAASPMYHHWLTPTEIGERYGLGSDDLTALTDWLESEGLHVGWVGTSRNFIGFTGSAGDVNRAFQTELNYYNVAGERRMSIASAPMIPARVAPLVGSIRGLFTLHELPQHQMRAGRLEGNRVVKPAAAEAKGASPELTLQTGENFIAPGDFVTLYDSKSTYTGKGMTIGLVGRSRTDFKDFDYFRKATKTTFANPTEIVPSGLGGIDPGPALTVPPPSGISTGDQGEAELDVTRSATVAPGAKVLLVVSTSAGGDIGVDAQYLIQTDPVPAQVMSISFGLCESKAGGSGVNFWDQLFKTAAGEGISVFVSSGDAGASGCDSNFQPPPASPAPNSPNYICSSSYSTCVGGTEFNDAGDYALYWTQSNGPDLSSALSSIPEGAWNEPQDGNGQSEAASTGGGVSSIVPTPSWQTGKGVPAAKAGRYTPDVAFSAAGHDGYFACFAAAGDGDGCVPDSKGGFGFVYFSGTSAAAPDMAGIAALLDEKEGKGQGNLNPKLYSLAGTAPKAFHDVTIASSGVTNCSVKTPSMCNNSDPGPGALTGGQAGYVVGAGYDEATGLGSLDIVQFLDAYGGAATTGKAPTVTTGKATLVASATATLGGTVNPNGAATQYWFYYGKSSTLAGAAKTAVVSASGSAAAAVTAKIAGLLPLTKYYFQLQAKNATGTTMGAIASFTTAKASQTITFTQPKTPVTYGVAPMALVAKASSGLAVKFSVVSGPGKVSGSTLTVTGAGTIVIAANQAGNASVLAATKVTRSITVNKAKLTVTAKSLTMKQGAKVPVLSFVMTGWVNADNRGSATKGAPALSTTATSKSVPKTYPIMISVGTVVAPNYALKFVYGVMTVTK